jgi:hypothetical protein
MNRVALVLIAVVVCMALFVAMEFGLLWLWL